MININNFLYNPKKSILTDIEKQFFIAIRNVLPETCTVLVQQNLAAIVNRTDGARFHNELFRNVDFLIVDSNYKPLIVIEINDSTHESKQRQYRDIKVKQILEEAGIPTIVFWTKYGVNEQYIKKRLQETFDSLPIERVHHFSDNQNHQQTQNKGCYIATCVYQSYDCPEVWTLRRFRDNYLDKSLPGKIFIKIYYKISPTVVKWFGEFTFFTKPCKFVLDKFVKVLKNKGYKDTPYKD